tara:strand:- start:338 stop:1087 length:750 start_codon:yes stop_codon:yes gene_type:complete
MVIDYPLYGEPCTLAITIVCEGEQNLRLIVEDANNEETMLTNRTCLVNTEKTYYVRIPMSPDIARIELFSEDGDSDKFDIEDISVQQLPTDYSDSNFNKDEVKSFINFAEEFSYYAGSIPADAEYESDDGVFTISYLTNIKSNGQVVATPARVSQNDGLIEVSKSDFLRYTIPMRMAILLHEFAHFYLNDVMEDEVEADKNSLGLYLGMGYPRIDAYNVYLDVFENSPSELNKERYEELNKLFNLNYKA